MEPAGFGLGDDQGLGVEETLVSRTDPEGTADIRTRPATEAQWMKRVPGLRVSCLVCWLCIAICCEARLWNE